jgi:hypothetical protein
VAAVSRTDAWAVGLFSSSTKEETLTLRWNGTAWKRVTSPSPGGQSNILNGVAQRSGVNALAVGDFGPGTMISSPTYALLLHWNGSAWNKQ